MKVRLLILLALLSALARGQPYPVSPDMNKLGAAVTDDRKANAPYYAEGFKAPPPSANVRIERPAELVALDRLNMPAESRLPTASIKVAPVAGAVLSSPFRVVAPLPPTSFVRPVCLRLIEAVKSSDPVTKIQPRALPGTASMTVDPFDIKQEFIWHQPHGQWMNQMLMDIEKAKASGDIETYNTLVARYTAWAEKYLRSENPPNLDGNPGR